MPWWRGGTDVAGQLIELTIHDRIARLVLQRPTAGNAFTGEMMRQLAGALSRAGTEADILALSAAGDDFSLGRDRQEPKSGSPFDAFTLVTEVNAALASFPGVIVAAVHGRAFGFAVGLVMRSDVAIAADSACFALDEVKLGIPPMFILAEMFEHLPPKAALDVVLSSREFTAAEAREMGLVSRVVPADRLQAASDEFVKELRSRNPAVLLACKRYAGAVRQMPPAARGAYALVEQTRFAEQNRY